MAAERHNGKRGGLLLLLAWAVVLIGLAALAAWAMTRPSLPPSLQTDRQAYEAVLPKESPPEAETLQQAQPRETQAREDSGPEEKGELTRPPELREDGAREDGAKNPRDGESPTLEEAPLITREDARREKDSGGDTSDVDTSNPLASQETTPSEDIATPEVADSEIQADSSAPAIPEEDTQSGTPPQADTAGGETEETSTEESEAEDIVGEDNEIQEDAETQDEDRQQPAFAPPQSSPGLPPPPIPGRADSETERPPEGDVDTSVKEEDGTRAIGEETNETVQAALPDPSELPAEDGADSAAGEITPAWKRYAQPFTPQENRPLVAVVVSGLGLSDGATDAAIRQLPAEITLSFSPYARRLDEWISLARSQGHEVLLDLPMEPENYPVDDPGPQAVLTELEPRENAARLQWVLGRGSAYMGVTAAEGGGFRASRDALEPLFGQLAEEGLIFLGNPAEGSDTMREVANRTGMPFLLSDRILDGQAASRSVIDAGLAAIARTARNEGNAIAVARPYPVSLERLQTWSEQLDERGLQLAPLSALLQP